MVNNENLEKMYEKIIGEKELTTKELKECGFNSADLKNLILNQTLKRIKRGHYIFLSIDNLFYYGKKLISLKKYERAEVCFKKCYELNPNHSGVCFQLFLRCIQNKDYEKAFEYFDKFYISDNEFYNRDSKYYLYLLSIITEIPEHHREYVKNLEFKDIKIDVNDKRYEDENFRNQIRMLASKEKFNSALKQLNELIIKNGNLSVQDVIEKKLLIEACKVQNNVKMKIVNLAAEKKYDEIVIYLEKIQKQHNLSFADYYSMSIASDISKFKNTGIIPKKKGKDTNKLFEAINNKNYELALSLSKQFITDYYIKPNDNVIYMLLKDMVELIQSKEKIDKPIQKINTKPKLESIYNVNCIADKITFATIIGYLTKQDFDNLFKALRSYLNELNKNQYEFLIVDLIKISLMENDMAFTKPMIALTYISKENFNFDISEYIQSFYEKLSQNKFDEARLYLDIISNAKNLGQDCIFTDELEKVLNKTEKDLNSKKDNEDNIDDFSKNVEEELIIQDELKESIQSEPISQVDDTTEFEIETHMEEPINEETSILQLPKKEEEKTKSDYADKLIQSKLNELHDKGIVLLKQISKDRIKEIHDTVANYPDIISFSIGSDGNQIILKYNPTIEEDIDISAIAKEGNDAYKSFKYNLSIEKYRQILEFLDYPKAWVYARLGLAYMKKNKKETAIDYLTIATGLSMEEQSDYDFTQLIDSLKEMINPEDKKPRFKMNLEDFDNDIDNYYEIENIHEIVDMITSGISLDEVCTKLKIDDNQKAVINLILAREYYALEDYFVGDCYFKKASKIKNKSKSTNMLLEEVRKNKKFYKNRFKEDHKILLLSPKENQ